MICISADYDTMTSFMCFTYKSCNIALGALAVKTFLFNIFLAVFTFLLIKIIIWEQLV